MPQYYPKCEPSPFTQDNAVIKYLQDLSSGIAKVDPQSWKRLSEGAEKEVIEGFSEPFYSWGQHFNSFISKPAKNRYLTRSKVLKKLRDLLSDKGTVERALQGVPFRLDTASHERLQPFWQINPDGSSPSSVRLMVTALGTTKPSHGQEQLTAQWFPVALFSLKLASYRIARSTRSTDSVPIGVTSEISTIQTSIREDKHYGSIDSIITEPAIGRRSFEGPSDQTENPEAPSRLTTQSDTQSDRTSESSHQSTKGTHRARRLFRSLCLK